MSRPPLLHSWYLADDDSIHFSTADGGTKRTTKVVVASGLVATTASGRKYRLGHMHPLLVTGLNTLQDVDFDVSNPMEFPELLKDAWVAGMNATGEDLAPAPQAASSEAPSYRPRGSRLSRSTDAPSPSARAEDSVGLAPPPPPSSRRATAPALPRTSRSKLGQHVVSARRGVADDDSSATPDDDGHSTESVEAPPPKPKPSGGGGRAPRPKRKGGKVGVRFGDVQIREYERVRLDSPRTGTPRLGLGWKLQHQTLRRLDSLEAERADTRVTKEHLQPLSVRERTQLVQDARGLLADNLSGEGRGFDAELDDWHLGADGSVYHRGGITSKVGSVDGRIVTTSAYGSKYKLLTVKPAVVEVLDRLGIPFDAENPLKNASSLVYAWTVHLSEPEMLQVRTLLADLQAKLLPFGASVKECFVNVDVAVRTLGFPELSPGP